jgi:hypothetical protein
MHNRGSNVWRAINLTFVLIVVGCLAPLKVAAAFEQTFPLLKIGTQTYRNVTVTTKSKNYVFFLHSTGMLNVKVADLPADVRESLGYVEPKAEVSSSHAALSGAQTWAKKTLAGVQTPQLRSLENRLGVSVLDRVAGIQTQLPPLTTATLAVFAGLVLGMYLFGCYCSKLICEKAGAEPGWAIWIPLLQMFPMLRAAKMSGWWFLAFLIPLLNLVAGVLWCIKIAEARNKNALFAILLLLPVTNILAFLYLAFSEGEPPPKKEKREERVQIMTLETA